MIRCAMCIFISIYRQTQCFHNCLQHNRLQSQGERQRSTHIPRDRESPIRISSSCNVFGESSHWTNAMRKSNSTRALCHLHIVDSVCYSTPWRQCFDFGTHGNGYPSSRYAPSCWGDRFCYRWRAQKYIRLRLCTYYDCLHHYLDIFVHGKCLPRSKIPEVSQLTGL